jgi:hypothetical protein
MMAPSLCVTVLAIGYHLLSGFSSFGFPTASGDIILYYLPPDRSRPSQPEYASEEATVNGK